MKFLRTAPTRRLLAVIGGIVAAIAAGTAIAVAATGGGPVPKAKPLARAVHDALAAKQVAGITADITFTNNLISADDLPGQTADPLLQGTQHGRVWLTNDHRLRIELQGDNGDANVVVNNNSFWISDPLQQTVYKGTLPVGKPDKTAPKADGIPTVAQIQSEITRLMKNVDVAGVGTSNPGDVAGRAAYSVAISPKHSGGLLGRAQLAWDAATGVPLRIAIYARGNPKPVLALSATNISYGAISSSDLDISPPSGDKVVAISTADQHAAAAHAARGARQTQVTGAAAVARRVPFRLSAPKSLAGLPREGVTLMSSGGKPAALVTYGQGLGGIAVIQESASQSGGSGGSGGGSGAGLGSLHLPSVSINGATGTELATPLGTVLSFTRGGVAYTVLGSVTPYAAETASRALTQHAP